VLVAEEEFTAEAQRARRGAKFFLNGSETRSWGDRRKGRREQLVMLVASATEMRHIFSMSMLTLTPTAARGNLSELLRRALRGDDIGIVVDGKIVALRPVAVESMDYAIREYGATAAGLDHFEQRTYGQIEEARKEGKLHDFTGHIEALLQGKGH
jgi:antitoxin (DNA-binding transcriptional repressor) of toxin-antitoxin stability system